MEQILPEVGSDRVKDRSCEVFTKATGILKVFSVYILKLVCFDTYCFFPSLPFVLVNIILPFFAFKDCWLIPQNT